MNSNFIFNLLTSETTTATDTTGTLPPWVLWVFIAVMLVGFFAYSTWSNKKKQKQADQMMNSIKIGDKIKTIGGICGYAYEIDEEENTITLKVTDSFNHECYIKFDRGAIYQTAPQTKKEDAKEEKPAEVKEEKVEEKPVEKKTTRKKAVKKEEPKQETTEENK